MRCFTFTFCAALLCCGLAVAAVGTLESPAAFMLEPFGAFELLSGAATSAAQIIASDTTAPTACRESAAKWLSMEANIDAAEMRSDQRMSLLGGAWLPCIKATAAELVADGVPTQHLRDLQTAAKQLTISLRTTKKLNAVAGEHIETRLKRAVLAFGAALERVHRGASDRSVLRSTLSPIIVPLVTVLTSPAHVDRLIRDRTESPPPPPGMELSYWKFVPALAGSIAQQPFTTLNFASRCFTSIAVSSSVKKDNKELEVTVTATQQTSSWCLETLLFWAGGAFALDLALWEQIFHTQKLEIKGKTAAMHAAQWADATTNGVRVFYSMEPLLDTIGSLLETVSFYFGPIVTDSGELSAVTEMEAALMTNTYLPLQAPISQPAPPSASQFTAATFAASLRSGDVIANTRLDGVDALFNWAQAENIGSVAIALCPPSAPSCLICESRAESSYWLTANGVQCHDAAAWFTLASNVSLNVVKLPLTDDLRAILDVTAAHAFAVDKLGIDYAYQNWAYAWLDTHKGNFPCFPYANWTRCMTFDHIEMLLVTIDNVLPALSAYLFGEGLNNRLFPASKGQLGMPVIEALMWALQNKKMTPMDVVIIPEEDTWPYYATRNGEIYNGTIYSASNFVCSVLRAGGAWTTPFSCSEATNFDVYSWNIYNASNVVQVLGDYALFPAPQFNSRRQYADMGNLCPAPPPWFQRPDNC